MNHKSSARGWTEKRQVKSDAFTQILGSALEPVDEAVTVADEDGYIIEINSRVEKVYGWPKEEIIGHHPLKFCPPDAKHVWDELSKRIWKAVSKAGEWNGVVMNHDKAGDTFPILLKVRVIKNANKRYVLSFARPFPIGLPTGMPAKEAAVFLELGRGEAIKRIGSKLNPEITESTVRTLIRRIGERINRAWGKPVDVPELALKCYELGWRPEMKLENDAVFKDLAQKAKQSKPKKRRKKATDKYGEATPYPH